MRITRFFYAGILILVFACCTQEEKPETTALSNQQENKKGTYVSRSDTSFSRVHSSIGQTIYVPVYSHIYQLNKQKTFNLTATLSFRNADLNRSVILTKVLYYDSEGNPVKNYLEEPIQINSLASTSFVVEEDDLRGGVGANFIVAWESEQPVYPPVVEAVMISTSQQQGISFVSTGRVLENHNSQ